MKKRILALVCAMTMVVGMSMTVCAAGSSSSSATASSTASTAAIVESATGQTIAETTLDRFAGEAKVETTVAGAKIEQATAAQATALVSEATKTIGKGAFIASVVDIKVPAGTGAAQFKISGISNVWAGQSVTILHQKADGSIEAIKPDKVENNAVTFTLTSYSPIAVVVNTTSPKTRDIVVAMSIIAVLALAGAAVAGKKVRQ